MASLALVYQHVGRVCRRKVLFELLVGALQHEFTDSVIVELQPHQRLTFLAAVEDVMSA